MYRYVYIKGRDQLGGRGPRGQRRRGRELHMLRNMY